MTANPITTTDTLQDYLAGTLSAVEHRRVERALARDSRVMDRLVLLRNTAALLRQCAVGEAQIPADWVEMLGRRARDPAKH